MAAAFLFAGLPQANYLSRHIESHICTINHIPIELLVGPVAPIHPYLHSTLATRYTPAMFTVPAPQYLPKPHQPHSLSNPKDQLLVQQLIDEVMKPLTPIEQGDGKMFNFFGQAILVGLGMGVSIIGAGLGGLWFSYVRYRGK
jgi:hypothetical protein